MKNAVIRVTLPDLHHSSYPESYFNLDSIDGKSGNALKVQTGLSNWLPGKIVFLFPSAVHITDARLALMLNGCGLTSSTIISEPV